MLIHFFYFNFDFLCVLLKMAVDQCFISLRWTHKIQYELFLKFLKHAHKISPRFDSAAKVNFAVEEYFI